MGKVAPVMRGVSTSEQGVMLQVFDGVKGIAFQVTMSWQEMEKFVREHGKQTVFGKYSKGVSDGFREMMEMDPEK